MRLSLLSAGALAAVVGLTPALTTAQAGGPAPAQRRTASSSLQGIWNYSSLTPVERPAEFAGKPTLTPQEAAAYVKTLTDRNNTDRRDVSKDTDVARGYNNFWWDRGSGLAVVDGWARTSLVSDPADGRIPSLTPDGQRRQNERNQARAEHPADGPEDRSLAERCLSFNAGPPMLPGPYNNYVQILEFTDHVVISNEMIHDARIVSLTRREHLPQTIRRYQGDSIGKWNGRTLVVDTTNFTDKTNFRGAGDALHLVERFTRVDPDTLLYEFTVTDPSSFTGPWSVTLPMRRSDEQIYEYACHEGNHAMSGILGGARGEERQKKP
jgi:hypothetical protein